MAAQYAVTTRRRRFTSQDVESTAVFGQVDWDVTERLMLSVGGRWLDEGKEACMTVSGYPVNVQDQLAGLPKRDVVHTDVAGYDKTLDTYPLLTGPVTQFRVPGARIVLIGLHPFMTHLLTAVLPGMSSLPEWVPSTLSITVWRM